MKYERIMRFVCAALAGWCAATTAHCILKNDLVFTVLNAICVPVDVWCFLFWDRQVERARSRP